MQWEFFPTFFYTTEFRYGQNNFNEYAKKKLISVIENDLAKTSKNLDWDCDVKTNHHLKVNVMDQYKYLYDDVIGEFLHNLGVNTNILPSFELTSPWYNVYDKDDYQERHDHYPDHFSMIHFLEYDSKVHKSPKFFNPHITTRTFNTVQVYNRMYQPFHQFNDIEEGNIIFFPSFVPHLVEKNTSDKRRITIAMNINLR
jgi:hypothetical protein